MPLSPRRLTASLAPLHSPPPPRQPPSSAPQKTRRATTHELIAGGGNPSLSRQQRLGERGRAPPAMEYVNPLTGFRVDGRRPNEVTPTLFSSILFPVSPPLVQSQAWLTRAGYHADAAAQGRGGRRRQGRRVRRCSDDNGIRTIPL
jgi:hypothetical protein